MKGLFWNILNFKTDNFIQQKLSKTQITIFTIFYCAEGNFCQKSLFFNLIISALDQSIFLSFMDYSKHTN